MNDAEDVELSWSTAHLDVVGHPKRDGVALRRLTVYLPQDLATELAVYCARRDQSQLSATIARAVRALLRKES